MPQIFQVLCCYKCSVFQVHQTKKSNKWECKLCGEKQSVKRHYGIGTARDCRLHVQKLNGIRGEVDELKGSTHVDSDSENEEDIVPVDRSGSAHPALKKSKWSGYIDKTDEVNESSTDVDAMYLGETEVVLDVSKKRKRKTLQCPISNIKNTDIDCGDRSNLDSSTVVQTLPKTEKYLSQKSNIRVKTILFSSSDHIRTNENKIEPKIESKKEPQSSSEISNKIVAKPFVPPAVNSNSKWAQFFEDDESDDANDENDVPEISDSFSEKPQDLFALCNDDDLDSILDI